MKTDEVFEGTYAKYYEGGEWLGTFHTIKTEIETYLWMKMDGISDEKFEETKPYDGQWVTIEFDGGTIAEGSPMDNTTFTRILMDKHNVKVVLATDGTNDIYLYKQKGE